MPDDNLTSRDTAAIALLEESQWPRLFSFPNSMATTQEQLDEVNAAISRILTKGQSHGTQTRSFEDARLAELFAERQRLEEKLAGEELEDSSSGGGRGYIVPEYQ